MSRVSPRGLAGRGTHRSRTGFRDRVVVGVPLLGLPVDLTIAPAEGTFHLGHGKGTDCRAAGRPFIPAINNLITLWHLSLGLHVNTLYWISEIHWEQPSPVSGLFHETDFLSSKLFLLLSFTVKWPCKLYHPGSVVISIGKLKQPLILVCNSVRVNTGNITM